MPSLVVIGKQTRNRGIGLKTVARCFYDASVLYTEIESTVVSFLVHTMLA